MHEIVHFCVYVMTAVGVNFKAFEVSYVHSKHENEKIKYEKIVGSYFVY